MKIRIAKLNGDIIETESTACPLFEGGYVRLITEGTFLDIKKAQWLKTENIAAIEMIND